MPIYEYICNACRHRFKKLVGVTANSSTPACPACSSVSLSRQMSRFARVRTEEDALDAIADDVESMGDTEDPRALRRMMRDMSSAMGEDMDDEIEEMIESDAGTDADIDETAD